MVKYYGQFSQVNPRAAERLNSYFIVIYCTKLKIYTYSNFSLHYLAGYCMSFPADIVIQLTKREIPHALAISGGNLPIHVIPGPRQPVWAL
jgi:hypothetical protein